MTIKRLLVAVLVSVYVLGSSGVARAAETPATTDSNAQIIALIEQLTTLVHQLQAQLAAMQEARISGSDDADDDDEDSRHGDDDELEIDVEIRTSNSRVKIEQDDEEDRFMLATTDREEIISFIADRLDMSESDVADIIDFHDDDDDDEDEDEDEEEEEEDED